MSREKHRKSVCFVSKIESLKLWEGDKIFFRLMEESRDFFTLKLRYEGENLVETKVQVYGADFE